MQEIRQKYFYNFIKILIKKMLYLYNSTMITILKILINSPIHSFMFKMICLKNMLNFNFMQKLAILTV